MMRFQNALANARLTIQVLIISLGLLFVSNLFLILGWHHAQERIEVHVPPQIPSDGLTLQANSYPAASLYSFAFYIWQSLNHWPTNGTQDYKQAIQTLSPFLTPRFKSDLIRDYNVRLNQGELQDRIRSLQGLNGSTFDPKQVQSLGHDTWLITLPMRLTESMNINGNQVKDVAIQYTLRVVRYSVDPKLNPWGLALDGFSETPVRLQTYT